MKETKQATIDKIYEILHTFEKSSKWVAYLTFIFSSIYLIIYCCKDNIEDCLISLGTSIPVFLVFSTIIYEIGGRGAMWVSMRWERLKRKRKKHQEMKLQRGLELGMEIANKKHAEWEEWVNNGRDESNKPSPPERPEELTIFMTEEELE